MKYIIILKNGLKSQEFEVKDLEELYQKIDSGNYSVTPIRGEFSSAHISRSNIENIVDITPNNKE